jgi:uncharacterized protein YbjT (DUF2867 family)
MQKLVNFMGTSIKGESAFYDSAGEARISHIDARDIAAVAARVLSESGREGMAYDLSGPHALTYPEMAEVLSRALGRAITFVSVSDDDYRNRAIAAGVSAEEADALVDLYRYYRKRGGERGDRDRARADG